ncbi:MAG: class I SAM-dependent methyltransferase [Deltaproteobacteria bacterium]|nr:class I SAM-dependent methyltransferase [Deltaproteobacteria bacterium]
MKSRIRRQYYNLFSLIYDHIIRLHSRDNEGYLRKYLAEKAEIKQGENVLDICTGTGSVAIEFSRTVCKRGKIVGVDFSGGMLRKAKDKVRRLGLNNFYLIEANARELPFKDGLFGAITISHAFYELKGEEQGKAISEMARVAMGGGKFFIMEHEVPKNFFLKLLFYLRIYVMGSKDAKVFLKDDLSLFEENFKKVTSEITPTGRSKIIWGER